MLRHGVPAEREEVACYVDHRTGRAYCSACKHRLEPAGVRRSTSPDGDCDACGRPLAESVEVVTGTATVEYVPCKIF